MPELAEIFARYGPAYLQKYGRAMLPSHRRAMQDIIRCRTEAMGGQIFCCDHCGRRHYVYHSCRNRNCPKCHGQETEAWLDQRRQELLPITYFHLVFTVPDELHACMRSRQTALYSILMRAAAQATIRLAADPHYVGGLVGILALLHTWGRNLSHHPHIHCLVTGGGLDRDAHEWRSARDNFLIPVKALSRMFQATFKELSGPLLRGVAIPPSVWRVPWVVNCQPVRGRLENALNYLARYVHRIAITNNRILAINDGRITFGYRDTRDQKCKQITLPAEEFIRRFLQHVLPTGFHKVRYYGLWAPGNRHLLRELQWLLVSPDPAGPSTPVALNTAVETPDDPPPNRICPYCHEGILLLVGLLRPQGRAPP
jgi:hypothetical protein